jgi:uncharacterized membrane protein YccC
MQEVFSNKGEVMKEDKIQTAVRSLIAFILLAIFATWNPEMNLRWIIIVLVLVASMVTDGIYLSAMRRDKWRRMGVTE